MIFWYVPMKSGTTRPSLNLPVGFFESKLMPYGRKSALITVVKKLLFPTSTVESPKMMIASGIFRLLLLPMLNPINNAKHVIETAMAATERLAIIIVGRGFGQRRWKT